MSQLQNQTQETFLVLSSQIHNTKAILAPQFSRWKEKQKLFATQLLLMEFNPFPFINHWSIEDDAVTEFCMPDSQYKMKT